MRVHRDRRNLIIHLIAVPLFVGSMLVLIVFLSRANFVPAIIAVVPALFAMALQGKGHALESHAPVPFSGPGNFLKRWFAEQFFIFPLFVLTGRWWNQFKATSAGSNSAA